MNELPAGWVEATLGEICLPVSSHRPADRPGEEFTYIDIGGIEAQRIGETKRLHGSEAPSRARQLVVAGDTILSTVRTYLKKTALVPDVLDGATASTGFCVLRPAPGIEPRFVFYRAIEEGFVSDLSARQTGSSYPAVRDTDVLQSGIGIPPTSEQQRIVAAIEEQLSRLDAAEASLRRARRNVGRAQAATLGAAFSNHRTVELDEISPSMSYGTSTKCSYERAGTPVLRIPNIKGGRVDLGDLKYALRGDVELSSHLLEPGDLLVVRTNGSKELIGRVAPYLRTDAMAFASYLIRVRLDQSVASPEWVSLALATPSTRRLIEARAATTAGQYNLNLQALRTLPVPFPPLDEQRRIVAEVERRLSILDATKAAIDRALERSKALRRAILERAFTGRLVPQDPSDEPASVLLERIRAERGAATLRRRAPSRRRATMAAQPSLPDVVGEPDED